MVILLRFVWEPRPRNLYDVCNDPIRKTTLRIVLLTRLTVFLTREYVRTRRDSPPPPPPPPFFAILEPCHTTVSTTVFFQGRQQNTKKNFCQQRSADSGVLDPGYTVPPLAISFSLRPSLSLCVSLSPRGGGRAVEAKLAGCLSVCFRWCRLMMGIRVWQDSRANCSASATLERREKGGNQ